MTIHDGFLELAAASIDFEIDEAERRELDRHLAGCDACRATAVAFDDDADAIARLDRPVLAPARADAVLDGALHAPRRGRPGVRLLAVVAVIALLVAGGAAIGLELIRRAQGEVAVVPSPGAGGSQAVGASGGPTQAAGSTPRPAPSPRSGSVPVATDAGEFGADVRMTPAASGDLYVSIPDDFGTTLVAIDSTGTVRPGWPIFVPETTCPLLLAARDGSIRVVCHADDLTTAQENPRSRAFAFGADGTLLPGWPVALPCCFAGRLVDDELTLFVHESVVGTVEAGQPAGNGWIVTIATDGSVHDGAKVPFMASCCGGPWAMAPDGVAYATLGDASGARPTSQVVAVSAAGIPSGFPVVVDGIVSPPAFDAIGRIHVTVGSPTVPPTRTLVLDPDGRIVNASSTDLDITETSDWSGAGGEPAPPLVGDFGTTFIVDTTDGTRVLAVDPSGAVMSDWPYQSSVGLQETGACGAQDAGCGLYRATPAVGPDEILHVLHAAAGSSAGGSIVAIGRDGRIVDGWPVRLKRPGSAFWSVAVGPDRVTYTLAVEPEPNNSHSATILAIAPDSTVLYRKTIIEP